MTAIGRHEVYGLPFLEGKFDILAESGHRTRLGDAHGQTALGQSRLHTRPDDVVDGEFVTEDDGLVVVDVDDGGQTFTIEAKEVEERGVLTERIVVIGVVIGGNAVAQHKDKATAKGLLQALTALDVGLSREHRKEGIKGVKRGSKGSRVKKQPSLAAD